MHRDGGTITRGFDATIIRTSVTEKTRLSRDIAPMADAITPASLIIYQNSSAVYRTSGGGHGYTTATTSMNGSRKGIIPCASKADTFQVRIEGVLGTRHRLIPPSAQRRIGDDLGSLTPIRALTREITMGEVTRHPRATPTLTATRIERDSQDTPIASS